MAKLSVDPNFAALPFTFRPALLLAVLQAPDGVWNNSMLTVPSARAESFQGVGTIPAARRLLEYGWDRDAPPLTQARRTLFRLLAEDEDPAYLYELVPRGKTVDRELVRHGRALLREAAAAALAHAGYESDPRLRGAARRILERIDAYLRSPLAQKPFVRSGNQHVLPSESSPPSMWSLTMLAHMPLFRSEHYEITERLYEYLTQPQPRAAPAMVLSNKVIALPHLVMGDPLPHRNAVDADIPAALNWLELMARLAYLRRNETWSKLYERFLDERDRDGIWRPSRSGAALRSTNPIVWPGASLEEQTAGDERWSDVTFRLGLIARLSGRGVNLM
ncbi:MAG TPA: hypothetical protein VJ672_05080 [Gemmatimonadaceae bacterium]|nr:hypothetical protein [Gemmatimonadaceae bacterium]